MKKIVFIAISLLVATGCFSQTPDWAWGLSGASAVHLSYMYSLAVATDASGNAVIAGCYYGTFNFGSDTLIDVNTDTFDIFIAKYNTSGTPLWARSAKGSNTDEANAVTTDRWGNVYVTGFFNSPTLTFGTTVLTNLCPTGGNIFLAKYDAAGNFQWAKSAGGTGGENATSITADSTGNVYITGFFGTPFLTFGSSTITNTGIMDLLIAKYDSAGNAIWAVSAGGNNEDWPFSIVADNSGHLLLTGFSASSAITFGTLTLTNTNYPNNEIFLARYDTSGHIIWARNASSSNTSINGDRSSAVCTDSAGNAYVTGFYYEDTLHLGAYSLINAGGYDMYVAKYDTAGNVVWAKRLGSAGGDFGAGIQVDYHGNIYVAGYFNSDTLDCGPDTLYNPTSPFTHILVVKYDNLGNIIWAMRAGGTFQDDALALATDALGEVYITGYLMSSSISFGSVTINNGCGSGTYDGFLVKIGIPTTSIKEEQLGHFSVYPNPSTGNLFIEHAGIGTDLKLMNLMGQTVYHSLTTQDKEEINIANLQTGLYLLQLTNSEGYRSSLTVVKR